MILIAARPMIWVAFDATYAGSRGISVRAMDSIALGLALAVTVVGLKIVGLVLIVALLIIPPVAARFWTDRAASLVVFSGIFGAVSGYLGTSISATAPNLPTGPLIVLTSFGIFLVSMLVAPTRGILAAFVRYRSFQTEVHLRQGLLALAQKQPIFEKLTVRLLKRHGFIRADGVPTEQGRIRASNALRDEARWRMARKLALPEAAAHRDGMIEIEAILTPDQVADIDRRIAGPQEIT